MREGLAIFLTALWSDGPSAWYAAEWAIRLGALAAVPLRRSPSAAASWLLLFFFLPVAGLLLYLAVGRPDVSVARRRRWRQLRPFFADAAARLRRSDGGGAGADAGPVGDFAERLGRMPCVGGNAVELIDDYDRVVDRLVADIDAATVSVDLLVYIFADDHVGARVAEAMARAGMRGVRCRVVFDPLGSHRWRRGTRAMLARAGADVREALPAHLLRRRGRADMRNHRKLFVIDGAVGYGAAGRGAVGYAGSQNLVAKDFRPGVVNRELVARVTGPAVAAMAAVVEGDWAVESRDAPAPRPVAVPPATGSARLQLLPSGAAFPVEGFKTLLVWLLHRADCRAVVVTPYFVPDEDVAAAMRSAALRGVAVDLVVSAVVDQRVVHLAQCSYFADLLDAGVRVRRYRDFLLHAKNVCVDDRVAILGSSNVDLRSFRLNEEVSLLLHDRTEVAAVAAVQAGYLANSDAVDADAWRRRPRARRLAENVARLMSPLL